MTEIEKPELMLAPEMRSHIYFTGLLLVGAAIYFSSISELAQLVFQNETYSYISLIPLVSLFLLAFQRKNIFVAGGCRPVLGFAVCAVGLVLYSFANLLYGHLGRQAFRGQDVPNDHLSFCLAGAVAWVSGSFITAYGMHAFKKARFAILFLIFTIPIPMILLDGLVVTLQLASAEVSDIVFRLTGASYYRSGLVFEFSSVVVQVAEQCSGIRSSLSLFILSVITGYLFLSTLSRRLILTIAIFPIAVVKNAFRIVAITLLANFVDVRFLTNHWIHTSGGIPFFAVALAMFIPLVWLLRKTEKPDVETGMPSGGKLAKIS